MIFTTKYYHLESMFYARIETKIKSMLHARRMYIKSMIHRTTIQSDREIKIQWVLYQPKQIGGAHNEGNKLLGVGTKLSEGHESCDD